MDPTQDGVTAAISVAALRERVGGEIGVSPWLVVDQARIDAFADATLDHQFIHVDPARAAATPFGGTVAHGFLTVSLLSHLSQQALPALEGRVMGINYGFERLRFVAPVPAGSRIRGRFVLAGLERQGAGDGAERWLMRLAVTVEIEGAAKPALVAEWLAMQVLRAP